MRHSPAVTYTKTQRWWNPRHNSEGMVAIPPRKMTKPSMRHSGVVSKVMSASKCAPDRSGEVWHAKNPLASLVLGWAVAPEPAPGNSDAACAPVLFCPDVVDHDIVSTVTVVAAVERQLERPPNPVVLVVVLGCGHARTTQSDTPSPPVLERVYDVVLQSWLQSGWGKPADTWGRYSSACAAHL
eukprot:6464541-Amphidinium_carterae.2